MPDAQPPAAGKTRTNLLRMCPDCGGILELTRPGWMAIIDVAAAARPQETGPARWQCLICGYQE